MISFADRLAAIEDTPPSRLGAALAAAVLASVLVVWLAAGSAVIAAAYAGGVTVLVLALAFSQRLGRGAGADEAEMPDWTVTAAAIDNPRRAIAVTDRANRMVCANATYQRWFASVAPPSELGFGGASGEGLALAARTAWRDGTGEAPKLVRDGEDRSFSLVVDRAGRGEDYLVWHFAEIVVERTYDGLSQRLSGPMGRMMSRSGLEFAFVGPDGIVMGHTPGLADRASGDAKASLVGEEFGMESAVVNKDR